MAIFGGYNWKSMVISNWHYPLLNYCIFVKMVDEVKSILIVPKFVAFFYFDVLINVVGMVTCDFPKIAPSPQSSHHCLT